MPGKLNSLEQTINGLCSLLLWHSHHVIGALLLMVFSTPQGPKGENVGSITQPLPGSHLIFRAASESDGEFRAMVERNVYGGECACVYVCKCVCVCVRV